MRVIAGTYRSRLLQAPRGMATRPTSDRLRETLFNVLGARVPGCRFVDLYAGTGAVGIEALSRGAEHVWFAERVPAAVSCLKSNLAALKIAGGFTVDDRGAGAMLQRLLKFSLAVDLVFLDPPYEAAKEYEETLGFLGSQRGMGVLTSGALVIAEHGSKVGLAERYGALARTRVLKQGDASLSFFAVPGVPGE